MEFKPGDNVEISDGSIGIVKRCDTEYMEPLYEVEWTMNSIPIVISDVAQQPWIQKQWFLGKDLKLISTLTPTQKECPVCHGDGRIFLFNSYVRCRECQ